MAREFSTAKQAKRYSDQERAAVIKEFRASGLTLSNFCKQRGKPSYQIVKAWLSESITASTEEYFPMNLHQRTSPDQSHLESFSPTNGDAYINFLYSKLAELRNQLAFLEQEIIKLSNDKAPIEINSD
ncbi:hypothetical protein [Pseudomonas sp. NMI795_08]|jgi:hypothetical protein|uniref:hypothetical protein n=1 Tax=Pseudomonas sp. NMI795_08 TaxID=2903144 RepID=UPI001E334C6E|nr:hypothetical protein [Pseudomonas sp. NMI795_08]MCE1116556.1 hypothetical protein [Pseudomonas sp. NMI795_08]